MKLLNKLICLLFSVTFLSFSVYGKMADIDLDGFPARDVRVPLELYEDGSMKVQLFAQGARVSREGVHERKNETELAGVRVEFYTLDGEIDGRLFAENCIYHSAIKAVMSERFVKIEKQGLVITGTGFKWKSKTETFELMNKAKVDFPGVMKDVVGNGDRTVIKSNYLKFDYDMSLAYFKGNVRVDDSRVDMTSDRLTVLFEGTNSIKTVTADGNVKAVSKEGSKGTCDKAIYFDEESKILMTGDVTVSGGEGNLSGNKVTVWLDEGRMTSEPGRLVVPERGSGMSRKAGLFSKRKDEVREKKAVEAFVLDAEPLKEAGGI
jgi:lipopolysaccharide transport protein LptA